MAATAAVAPAPAPAPAAAASSKPTQPDRAAFEKELARLEKENKDVLDKLNAVKNKIALAIPDKANPSPSEQRRQELIAQAKEIQKKQGAGKDQRLSVKEKIQKKEEELRATLAELKAAQEKVPFRSVAEIDRKINELEAAVEKGTMKLVDERKALTEASNLRRLKKSFSKYADMQKKIDDLRAEIKELKASMDTAEAKALSEEYQRIQAELDALDKERKEASANLTALKKERDALRKQQQAAYAAIKAHKDAYYDQRRAWDRYIKEQKRKRAEREKAERERIARERRMERAQRMLAEASEPAYLEEIRRANNLLHYFDPSHPVVEKKALIQDKGLAAAPQRKVTEDDLVAKGMVRLARKEDRMEEYLPAKKTGKKGGNKKAAEAPSNKFSVPPSVVEDCAFIGVEPPMSAAEVPGVMEKIRAKLEQWKIDQPIQTQKNIEKAKAEIARLEAEEDAAAAKEAAANASGSASGRSSPAKEQEASEKKEDAPAEEKAEANGEENKGENA
ncbi:nuclear segregation protein (bfr1)-like protein [Thermochaetoides thermophila DSM 1495]|uniref:Nuclear segregation protein (Bfr1)-like protein n=1 Tax=Chaetomium thermophilum (strain DSM 1495 / CBS 144.50 / IMI 039719) TaxID=759272 RepID=G0S3P7_CHATD|nr:nuclear segregation protein (bfr1)-like protein [Thermochaetoides thermophila DSM 1495]EGS21173.1 nuclear segregation protein (bfr1)-like protein [Thermochaetoides thermophila DSM 1495]